MLVVLFSVIIAMSGLAALVSFVVYAIARMRENEQREKLFLRIHYTSLFIVVFLGMALLFIMVNKDDQ